MDPSLEELSSTYKYDPNEALTLLKSIGYNLKGGALYTPEEKKLRTFKITVCQGWTDYISMAEIIVDNLKAIGISAIIDQQPYGGYVSVLQSGTYDMGIYYPRAMGPNPIFPLKVAFSEVKKEDNTNISRYNNPEIIKALSDASSSPDKQSQKAALNIAMKNILNDAPWVTLVDRAVFLIFVNKHYTGWPTDADPYFFGDMHMPGTELMLLNVRHKE
jgi:peptide/nickel transport system substrate-binding protein